MNRKEVTDASDNVNTEQDGNTAVAKASLVIHGTIRDWVIGIVLSLSLVGNLVCAYEFSRKEQAEDLKRYDLDFFTRNEYSPLKAQVIAHETLINSLILKGCKQEK